MKMKVKVAAKINLMLDILKKLPNGYHSLFMIMQSVDLYDTITVDKNNEDKIIIKCDTEGVPCNEKNIVYKCADAFFNALSVTDRGITITIEKNIPMAAGTAGGSADGAGVLYCFNKLSPEVDVLKRFKELGGKYVSVGSDAHYAEHLAADIDMAYNAALEAGFDSITFFQKRTPIEMKIERSE